LFIGQGKSSISLVITLVTRTKDLVVLISVHRMINEWLV